MLALVVYKHGVTGETDLICHVQRLCFSKKQKDGFCRSTENSQEVKWSNPEGACWKVTLELSK